MKRFLMFVLVLSVIISPFEVFDINVEAAFVNTNVLKNGDFQEENADVAYARYSSLAETAKNGATGWYAYDASNRGISIVSEDGNATNKVIEYDKVTGNWFGLNQALPVNRLATGNYTVSFKAKNLGPSAKATLLVQLVLLVDDNGTISRHGTPPYRKKSYGFNGDSYNGGNETAQYFDVVGTDWNTITFEADVAPWLSNSSYIEFLNSSATKKVVGMVLEIRPAFRKTDNTPATSVTGANNPDYVATKLYIDDVSVKMPDPLISTVDSSALQNVPFENAVIPVSFNYTDGIYEDSLSGISVKDSAGNTVAHQVERTGSNNEKLNIKMTSLLPNTTYTLSIDKVVSSTPVPNPSSANSAANANEKRYVSMMEAQTYTFTTLDKIVVESKAYDSSTDKATVTFKNNSSFPETYLIAVFEKNSDNKISTPVYYKTATLTNGISTPVEIENVDRLTSNNFEVAYLRQFGGSLDTSFGDTVSMDINFSSTNQTLSFSGNLGTAYAGKTVTAEILVPKTDASVNDVPQSTQGVSENVFLDIAKVTVEANGSVNSAYPIIVSESGTYRIIAKVDDKVFADETKFFSSKVDNDNFIKSIDLYDIDNAGLLAILEKEHRDQKIRYDETYYNMLSDESKLLLCTNLLAKKPFGNIDNFKMHFADETLRMVLLKDKVPSSIKEILAGIYPNESVADITRLLKLDELQLLSVYNDYNGFTDDEKLALCTELANELSLVDNKNIRSAEEYADAFKITVLNNLIKKTLMHKDISAVLNSHTDILTGLNFSGYNGLGLNQSTVNESIKNTPQRSIAKFIQYVNQLITNATPVYASSNNSASFGGGSVSIKAEVPVPPVKLEENKKSYFSDIDSVDWAKDAIETLYERDIISGKGDLIFAPNDFVTREEFIKMIVVAEGIEPINDVSPFEDVSVDSWYSPYVAAAAQNNITKGIGNDLFGSGRNITRQDMFVMCAQLIEDTVLPEKEGIEKFSDSEDVADYAKDIIDKLVKLGIVNGNENGTLNPESTATRAEATVILYNILSFIGGL